MKRWSRNALILIFFILAVGYNSVGGQLISIAGMGVYSYLPISMLMTVLGFFAFIVTPEFARMDLVWRQLWILLLPILFPLLWSSFTWIINSSESSEIRRGIIGASYLAFGISSVAAFVYVAGERAVWWYLLSLIAGNMFTIVQVMQEGGVSEFIRQFVALVVSFADNTGPLMLKTEVQGLTYALGAYLTFFMIFPRNIIKQWLLFLLASFCFLTGLKRIGVMAVMAAAALGIVLLICKRFKEVERFAFRLMGVTFIAAAFAYVAAIYYGLFDYMETIGLDTNLRAHIYGLYKPYYYISPAFLGNGAGWVDDMFQKWQAAAVEWEIYEVFHTHNDFLRIYIELGFVGFLIWCYLRCNYQVSKAFRHLGTEGGILCLALMTYLCITYMTDSTAMQVYINNAFAVIVMTYHLREREEKRGSELLLENRRISDPLT